MASMPLSTKQSRTGSSIVRTYLRRMACVRRVPKASTIVLAAAGGTTIRTGRDASATTAPRRHRSPRFAQPPDVDEIVLCFS
eukprot:6212313-Pleurochrysis_carterae.AAC.11